MTAAPTNRYEDYVDWSERGNPRSTAENMWIDYRGYARNLAGMVPVETPHEERVVTLNEFYETRPESVRVDEYIVVECPCGQILDPGRPEPLIGGRAGCRHCDRAALNIETQRITLEDQIRMGERAFEDAQQFRGHLAMEQMKDDIRDRMED